MTINIITVVNMIVQFPKLLIMAGFSVMTNSRKALIATLTRISYLQEYFCCP